MNKHIAELMPKFREILTESGLFSIVAIEAIEEIVCEAIKSGYLFGLTDTTNEIVKVVNGMRNDVALVIHTLGPGTEDDPLVVGALAACDTFSSRLKEAIQTLSDLKGNVN